MDHQSKPAPSLLKWAISYARQGWPVLPLRPGSKQPLAGSHGAYDATYDLDQITDWWTACPTANIGIGIGPGSGVFVVDVDCKNGAPGFDHWQRLTETHGCPSGPVVITPSSGYHVYYQHRAGLRNTVSRIAPCIDTRGPGGYIVAPPSVVAGRSYRWVSPPSLDLPPVPDWIVERLADRPVVVPRSSAQRATNFNPRGLVEIVRTPPEGRRNANLFWAACRAVENGGVGLDQIAAAAHEVGLPAWEVRRTLASAARTVSEGARHE